MKDVDYAQAVASENWNTINEIIGVSGSCQVVTLDSFAHWQRPSGSSYDSPKVYLDSAPVSRIEVLQCKHCDQRHRVDYDEIDSIAILDCKTCGAPLI